MKSVELSTIAEIIAGQSPPSTTYNQNETGVPFFQGKADFNELYPTVRYWCSAPKKMSKPNDILFSLRAPVGPTNLNNIDACIGRGLAAIRVNESCSLSYVLHFLRANEEKIARLGTGSTFKAIKVGDLKNIQIPLPPLTTQKCIAEILDAADAYRQKTKALIDKYDELAQSLFLDMFGDPVTNPMGWEKKKFGDVSNMKAGKFIKSSDISDDFSEGLYKCYGGNGLRGFVESYSHSGDYILIGRQGALCGNVKLAEGKFYATEHAIVCSKEIEYNTIWMYYLLEKLNLNQYATGAAQPGLNVGKLKELDIVYAPINLQNKFVQIAETIEAQKFLAEKELEKAENLFQSLLQKAFKGTLV